MSDGITRQELGQELKGVLDRLQNLINTIFDCPRIKNVNYDELPNGFTYVHDDGTNAPSSYCYVLTLDNRIQIALPVTTINNANLKIYKRFKTTAGAWQPWTSFVGN